MNGGNNGKRSQSACAFKRGVNHQIQKVEAVRMEENHSKGRLSFCFHSYKYSLYLATQEQLFIAYCIFISDVRIADIWFELNCNFLQTMSKQIVSRNTSDTQKKKGEQHNRQLQSEVILFNTQCHCMKTGVSEFQFYHSEWSYVDLQEWRPEIGGVNPHALVTYLLNARPLCGASNCRS